MIAYINPAALPALTIAGILFLIIHLLAGTYVVRHWQQLFGPDPNIDGDRSATRSLQVVVVTIPFLFLTFRLITELVGLWIN